MKEGRSKEIKHLITGEVEKTQVLEWLMADEAKKSRQQEEKLQEMQKEMAEWRSKSPEPGIAQMVEQKEVLQKLEISKSLIRALQKEIHNQVDQIEGLHKDLESWQERCLQAEHLVEELREKLMESHTQAEEMRKVIAKEMEKVRGHMASHETLQDQQQSLETEGNVQYA
ncbi:hypothetical protein Y1Q_0000154 [Alligator mississippiensis]|uniref:Uncharacterized protein n=1 Tax=Alligator mississippiensis TaxID=8496 RepID=A0A151NUJ7_ALLMI|nr:hypothetical protein Y1Q_0000154 [Alligator mississippiensis]